jgi:hypothetical protein
VIGRSKVPSWWQDWRGECVAIIASGPSTKTANIAVLRDRIHVIAIKESVTLCPWAEIVYGCDGPWWAHKKGLPEFKGIKISQDAKICSTFNLNHLTVRVTTNKLLLDEPGTVGSGGNSGFQALNLAAQFGATGMLLIGYDMQGDGAHWYGRNKWNQSSNPIEENYQRWRRAFAAVAPDLQRACIDVVNASPASALTCFRKTSIEAALAGWGL